MSSRIKTLTQAFNDWDFNVLDSQVEDLLTEEIFEAGWIARDEEIKQLKEGFQEVMKRQGITMMDAALAKAGVNFDFSKID